MIRDYPIGIPISIYTNFKKNKSTYKKPKKFSITKSMKMKNNLNLD